MPASQARHRHANRLLLRVVVLSLALAACSTSVDRPGTGDTGEAGGGATTSDGTVPSTTNVTEATTTTGRPVPLHVFPIEPVAAASYSPGHHDYPATDIFCPTGSSFVAPTSGTVDSVSTVDTWDPSVDDPATRGGLSVAIVGDDGVRYYGSHLSSVAPGIEPGAKVSAGQVLGLTGKSGNAANVDPHLHFGISRPTTPDDWAVRRGEVDTFPILQAWERGENLTPVLPSG